MNDLFVRRHVQQGTWAKNSLANWKQMSFKDKGSHSILKWVYRECLQLKGFNPTLSRDLNIRQSALQPHECDLAFFLLRHRLTVFYHQLKSMFSLLLYEPIINKRQKCVYEKKDTLVWGLAIPNFIAGKRNKPYKQLSSGGRKRSASKRCI